MTLIPRRQSKSSIDPIDVPQSNTSRPSIPVLQLRKEQELQKQELWHAFQEKNKQLELQHRQQLEHKFQVVSVSLPRPRSPLFWIEFRCNVAGTARSAPSRGSRPAAGTARTRSHEAQGEAGLQRQRQLRGEAEAAGLCGSGCSRFRGGLIRLNLFRPFSSRRSKRRPPTAWTRRRSTEICKILQNTFGDPLCDRVA